MSDSGTGTCSFCHAQHPEEECEELVEFERYEEELEARIDFLDREDYQGLVNYLEDRVARCPDDAHHLANLGEAYVLNGENERALELLKEVQLRAGGSEFVQRRIRDALLAFGRPSQGTGSGRGSRR